MSVSLYYTSQPRSLGNGNRTQHATDANKESSRSHAVLQVFIKLKDKDAGLSTEVKIAKMSLIDLAGSEKVSRVLLPSVCTSSKLKTKRICLNRVRNRKHFLFYV